MAALDRAPLIPAERDARILGLLAREGVASIARLTTALGVSHMTVRRDIRRLEAEGRVTSVAGGVRLPEPIASEPSHAAKAALMRAQKAAIGAAAAAMVPARACVYLDAGTTTLQIALRLAQRDDLTIVTNDFVVCAALMGGRCRLHHTGGAVDRANQSCTGDGAAAALARFSFDLAFLSTSSWELRGVTTPAEEKCAVKRAAADSAARTLLAADSTKYGRVGAHLAVPLTRLAGIVTDDGAPPALRAALAALGVEMTIAPVGAEGGTA